MNPELSLLIIGCLAEFLLRSTLAFVICLILNQLVTKASARFFVWVGFLTASAAYWVYLAATLLARTRPTADSGFAVSQVSSAGNHSWATGLASWSIPQHWSRSLGIALAVLGAAYALSIFGALLSHASKLRRLRWVMGFATEPPAEISDGFHMLATQLGILPPRLRVLSGAFSPATFGWIRPVVMLPTLCIEEETPDLEDILLHELHHVRRRDAFWNALGTAARALICFHPAAWYAMRRMRIDRELACDQAVVAHAPSRRRVYAESLLRFARLNVAPEPANWSIDFAAPVDHLTIRVHSILAEAKRVAPGMLWLRTAAGVALLVVFVGVSPSLAVLLEYTHPLIRYSSPVIETQAPAKVTAPRATRKQRGKVTQFAPLAEPAVATERNSSELEAPMTTAASVEDNPVIPEGPGPHLQRRSSATPGSAKSQSIPLIDDGDTGQSGRHADAGQAVQQSATVAAAIWKRAGDLDRR